MKRTTLILTLLFGLLIPLEAAHANACSSAARQLAASMNADVISVDSSKDGGGNLVCVATLKVNSPGKPPRIVTRTFKP